MRLVSALFIALLILETSAMAEPGVHDEGEAGIVVTNGNTHTQSYNAKNALRYSVGANLFELKGSYLKSSKDGVLSSLSWLLGLRYEREINERTSGFLSQNVEGDEFAGILQRYNTDLGAKYFFHKEEKVLTWFAEGGYRYTNEHATTGTKKGFQKARLYSEVEKFWTEFTSLKFWVEYVPNFTVSEAWILNSELSVNSAINSVFAIKTGYLIRYNHLPPVASAQKADSTFTTSLVAKF